MEELLERTAGCGMVVEKVLLDAHYAASPVPD